MESGYKRPEPGERWPVAFCPEHGLHGCRDTCFECGQPVEQIDVVLATQAEAALEEMTRALERIVALAESPAPNVEDWPWRIVSIARAALTDSQEER